MLIKKGTEKKNSDNCSVWEYPFDSSLMSFATARIEGRYPEKGEVCNESCEEIYYVISGKGVIHSEFGDFALEKEDVYHFRKGEKYYVEGEELFVALVNAPPWTEEQHKEL